MAHVIVIDEGVKGKERFKVMYEIQTLDGRRKRKSKTFPAGTTRREVERFKKKVECEFDDGATVAYKGEQMTLKEFCTEYFEVFTENLSPLTVRGYENICYSPHGLLAHFNPEMKLSKITMVHLQNYLNMLHKDGRSKKTISNTRGFISVLFKKAHKAGYIKDNPALDLTVPYGAKPKKEAKFLDVQDAMKALTLSASMGGHYETVIWLGLLAGLRKGEMAGLRYENIFIDDGMSELHIVETRVAAGGKVFEKDPKSEAGRRVVQIPEILAEMLRRKRHEYKILKLQGGQNFNDEGYVFCDKTGQPFNPDRIYQHHRRFMQKLVEKYPEIDYVKLHGLRHSYASIAVNGGMQVKSLMSQLGHSEVKMTMELYAHAFEDAKKAEVAKINDTFKCVAEELKAQGM